MSAAGERKDPTSLLLDPLAPVLLLLLGRAKTPTSLWKSISVAPLRDRDNYLRTLYIGLWEGFLGVKITRSPYH